MHRAIACGLLAALVGTAAGAAPPPPGGRLDSAFGHLGKVDLKLQPSGYAGEDQPGVLAGVLLQRDGKIIVGGHWTGNGCVGWLARLKTNGTLDTTFGSGGKVVDLAHKTFGFRALALLANGSILAVGGTCEGAASKLLAVRYTPAGKLDPAFGTGGIATIDLHTPATAVTVALQPPGKILLGGKKGAFPTSAVAVRLTPAGALDPSFGIPGTSQLAIDGTNAIASMVVQSDGKIIGFGSAGAYPTQSWVVGRLTSNGAALDTSFAGGAGYIAPWTSSYVFPERVRFAVASTANPRSLLLAGDNYLQRITGSGAVDSTFGGGRVVLSTTDFADSHHVNDVAVSADGAAYAIAVDASVSSDPDLRIFHVTKTGQLDPGWGVNGVVKTPLPDNQREAFGVLQSDGKLVVAVRTRSHPNAGVVDFASVLRYTPPK